jgi:tetratricopeptide (TPR) repeat protein
MRLDECGDWPPIRVIGDLPRYANCQSCHASQATVRLDTTAHRYDTRFTSLAINCESCHGPARRHVELATRGELTKSADIGLVSLATLDKDASLGVCYRCHAVKDQLHNGYLPGDSLARYYSIKFPLLGDRPLYPDGGVRTFAYQEAHQFSDCYLNGGLTCTSCHDPHSQQYRDVDGVPLVGRFDDRQCTSCHASKVDRIVEHSHHRAESPGARCTACHMPYRQEPETEGPLVRASASPVRSRPGVTRIPYARADHSISIPRPANDSARGLTSACARCHAGMSAAEQERYVRTWWGGRGGELKPVKQIVADQQRFTPQLSIGQAAPLLLGTSADSAGDRHAFARFAGAARFLENYVRPDMKLDASIGRRLDQLASHSDIDVRALVLATLHLARGTDGGAQRVLAKALRAAGPDDESLRSRWAVALGYMADHYASSGDLADAVTAYRRALSIEPSNARLALNLANAQRDAGNFPEAVDTYRRALALDASDPLTWVNFGIALGALGDTVQGLVALERASVLNPGEPLAWYNLANIRFVRGDLDGARTMYARATVLDGSLALAHFQLARIDLLERNEAGALVELRRGLAFDSSDASARQMAAALARRLGDNR